MLGHMDFIWRVMLQGYFGKVQLSLCLIKYFAVNAYEGVEE
jgi:hypothetical protein